MRQNRGTFFAAGAIFALVVGSGTAFAATGGKFILGQSNTAGATSTLTNKNGTALALNSRAGTAPLKVNSGTKVARLNADSLDGKDSAAFASVSGKTGYVTAVGQWEDVDSDGVYDAIFAFAECPAGTQLTGGGLADYTNTGVLVNSQPIGGSTWAVAVVAETTDNAADVEAYAVCYNPRGSVPGAVTARMASGTDSKQLFMGSVGQRVESKN